MPRPLDTFLAPPCTFLGALLALAAPAAAQWVPSFDVIAPSSNFTWSGTTSLGPLEGTPSNTFQMDGSADVALAPAGAQSLGSGEFISGDAFTVPDIAGQIPNPVFFLPPLATFSVTGLHVSISSDPFAISPSGDWTALGTGTALSGTLQVIPLVGAATVQDLTGLVSDPSLQSGTIVALGGNVQLVTSFDSTFPFDDPTSGISGSITLSGSILARWFCPAPAIYCTSQTNSQGCTPLIAATGAPSYSNPAPFSIDASGILNQKSGLMFYGYGQQATPFGGGTMCVTSPRKRTPIQASGGSAAGNDCSGSFGFDMNARIQSGVDPTLLPGQELFAQYWSRDPQGSGTTTNLTDAVQFTICP